MLFEAVVPVTTAFSAPVCDRCRVMPGSRDSTFQGGNPRDCGIVRSNLPALLFAGVLSGLLVDTSLETPLFFKDLPESRSNRDFDGFRSETPCFPQKSGWLTKSAVDRAWLRFVIAWISDEFCRRQRLGAGATKFDESHPNWVVQWSLVASTQRTKKALSSVGNLRECSTGLPPGLEQHIASDLQLLGQLRTAGASR